jgi:serine/threonine-protein kinase
VIGSGESVYVILGELGRGASGVVYKARPAGRPDKLVALKLIEGVGNIDAQLVEPEILSRLKHPNIIRLVDYFLVSGKLALAMEYVDGPDLAGWAEKCGRCSSAEVRDFLTQMARALAYAHAQGVVHRDIKPGNIMVTQDGGKPRFILADFGVSRQVEGIQVRKQLAGSYRFMAPEQLRGRATSQSDLWSLGVVAYWLLTGSLPFEGKTLRELSDQIGLGSPPSPSSLVGSVDPDIETTILELLQKDPRRRIDSATTLVSRLSGQSPDLEDSKKGQAAGVPTWEAKLSHAIGWRKAIVITCLAVWMIPELVVGPALSSLGVYCIYLQQLRRRGPGFVVLGLFLIALGFVASVFMESFKIVALTLLLKGPSTTRADLANVQQWNLALVSWLPLLESLVMAYNLAKWRLLERDRFFLRSLRTEGSDGTKVIEIFREYLRRNPEEIFVRQRLAELYSYAGRLKEALVESKLILSIDPYNFAASLLLAESYARLGLHREAIAVCDGYLAVSPQCFEFDELRHRCERTHTESESWPASTSDSKATRSQRLPSQGEGVSTSAIPA